MNTQFLKLPSLKLLLLLLILLVMIVIPVVAQSGGDYDLTWNTVDNSGGIISSGSTFSMTGSIGQPEAGVVSGGSFTLCGGFITGGNFMPSNTFIYLPLLTR